MARQAVETFCNLLAELRAYGQGVVVVEQLPSKLAPDIAKHSTVRIAHRMAPAQDRDLIGDAMVLTDPQKRALATLHTGEAIVHAEGLDRALRIRGNPPVRATSTSPKADTGWRRLGETQESCIKQAVERGRMATWLQNTEVRRIAEGALVAAIAGKDADMETLERELVDIAGDGRGIAALLRFALEEALLRRSLHYQWPTSMHERMGHLLCEDPAGFAQSYADACRQSRKRCSPDCRYCYEGFQISRDPHLSDDVDAALARDPQEWSTLVGDALALAVGRRWGRDIENEARLHRCALEQLLRRWRSPRHLRESIAAAVWGGSRAEPDGQATGDLT